MATNVKFYKGTSSSYKVLTPDIQSFYFLTDTNELYLGSLKLSNPADLETAIAQVATNKSDISGIVTRLNNLVGSNDQGGIVARLAAAEGKINALEAGTYDDTEIRGLISTNTTAINKLNGNATTVGSVAYQIAQIVNADNNGKIDTLKEIADWITNDTTGAAKMSSDISTNAAAISALEGLVGSTSVASQISAAISNADLDKYALASELTTLAGRVTTVEGKPAMSITQANINSWNTAAGKTWETAGAAASALASAKTYTDNALTWTTFPTA